MITVLIWKRACINLSINHGLMVSVEMLGKITKVLKDAPKDLEQNH
jgi:hypothetical protein